MHGMEIRLLWPLVFGIRNGFSRSILRARGFGERSAWLACACECALR